MPQCQHEIIGPSRREGISVRVCPVCLHEAHSSGAIKRECPGASPVKAERPREDRSQCAYRGELLRLQECKPCQAQGKPAIEVYACDQYKECTLQNTSIWPRIKGCSTCGKWQPPKAVDS